MKLKEIRESKLMTQEELERLSGIRQETISRLETATHKARFATIRKLAEALEVDPEVLVNGA